MPEKIIVVGAGPAGSMLAYLLAREGMPVLLFDHRAPWEKPCGGILSPATMREHPVLGEYPFSSRTYEGIEYRSPAGHAAFVPSVRPFPVVSRRGLGQFLIDRAVQEGARFIQEKVSAVKRQGKGWSVTAGGSTYEAPLLIGADGTGSIVRKHTAGKFAAENLALHCGYYLSSAPGGLCRIDCSSLLGYLWIVSRPDDVSTGIIERLGRGRNRELFPELDAYLRKNYPEARKLQRWAALLPSVSDPGFYDEPCAGADWMLLGDAAGHVDPVMGEGSFYALQSAKFAFRAICEDDLSIFDTLWRHSYGDLLRQGAAYMGKLVKLSESFDMEVMGSLIYSYFAQDAKEIAQ
jgi:flavin-dependent dehydrogenase